MQMPTFTLTEEPIVQGHHRGGRNRNGRRKPGSYGKKNSNIQSDTDLSDGNGSLSYSASSSVQSQSSAGESTDSSFAEILHVLDLGEDAELMDIVSREDDNTNSNHQHQHPFHSGIQCRSAFSNEASFSYNDPIVVPPPPPSLRSGRPRPHTFSGQTSNSLGPDKDSPTISTKTTKKKHTLDNNVNSHHLKAELYHQRFSKKLDVRSSPAPRPRNSKLESDGNPSSNRQLWYSQWWMCGFTDALNLNEW